MYQRTAFGFTAISGSLTGSMPSKELYRDSSTCFSFNNINLVKGSIFGTSMSGFPVTDVESFFIDSDHALGIANSLMIKPKK